MTSWTSGYVTDLGYTHGFYRELTPELIRFTALAKGLRTPAADAGLAYCELGCGQGFSANLLAAANPNATFVATDFNPEQAAGAQTLATEGGARNVRFFDHAFADLADEPELPAAFDIIALHGIYSWISEENRRHIVEFARRKLKVGGLLYISYNTQPGWTASLPLRRLLVDQAATGSGPIAPRIDAAIAFAERLQAVNAGYFTQNPGVAPRLEKLKGMSRNYLAHEYFNRDWTPFFFADLAAEMAEAKLSFVGSAHLLDHVDAVNLTTDQQALLNEVADPVRREGLRDLMVNQQFRRDVFVKGAVRHTVPSAREAWLETRFALSIPRDEVPMTVKGAIGEANLQAETYAPLLDAFARGPATVRDLIADPVLAGLGWGKLMQALTVLVGSGHLQPALPAREENKRAARTKAFNAAVCERAKGSADLSFLASPVTGGGVAVDRFQQLFLLARARKEADPAAFVWGILNEQGQRLVKDGQPLETPEANIARLNELLREFEDKRLPVLRSLGI